MDTAPVFVGIDVAKAWLDAAGRPGGHERPPNDEAGIAQLAERLAATRPARVVLEATGGLEVPVAAALAAAGVAVAVANPRQARDFAEAVGRPAKTDALDAALLAHFAEAVGPAPRPLPDAEARAPAAVLARRRQIVAMLVAEQRRLGTAAPAIRPRIGAHVAWLRQERDDTDRELRRQVRESAVWREDDGLLRSVPGVGPVLATTPIAELLDLGRLDRKQTAALVGVAPIACESGILRGRRVTWGGRARARAALWMGTLVAVRHDPAIRGVCARLLAAGKPKKRALTACVHKLLTILNALLRTRTPWRPSPPLDDRDHCISDPKGPAAPPRALQERPTLAAVAVSPAERRFCGGA